MKRLSTTFLVLAALSTFGTIAIAQQTPRTLFIDDEAIEEVQGLSRVANRLLKHPDNPVLRPEAPERPWEWRVQCFGTFLYDPDLGLFRAWYLAFNHPSAPHNRVFGTTLSPLANMVAYATSANGITWSKPTLGLVEFNGSRENNLADAGPNWCGLGMAYEPQEEDPKRRYKALYWDIHRGDMRVAFSPDGLRWTPWPGNPVHPSGSDIDHSVVWDPKIGKYVAYGRMGGVGRNVSRMESADFLHWSEPKLVFQADARDRPGDQIYGVSVALYEGIYVGLVWMYHAGDDLTIDAQLIHSRDGIHWRRTPNREVVIPLGPQGSWDSGIIFPATGSSCGFPMKDGKIYVYYFGMQGNHAKHPDPVETDTYWRGGIGLATLRRDGWVSLDAGVSGGYLVTKPLQVPLAGTDGTAPRLMLNTNAFSGEVRITVLDEQGKPIGGFEKSNTLHGDFLRTEVTWPEKTLAELVGKNVRLRIDGKLAKLYSYWFE